MTLRLPHPAAVTMASIRKKLQGWGGQWRREMLCGKIAAPLFRTGQNQNACPLHRFRLQEAVEVEVEGSAAESKVSKPRSCLR